MAEGMDLARVRLPPNLQADDVTSLFDQMQHRVAAVLVPAEGRKRHQPEPVALPAGVKPMAKLPELFAGAWERWAGRATALAAVRKERDAAATDTTGDDLQADRARANKDCDGDVQSFEDWLSGWAGARDDGHKPTPADARWLYDSVFPAPEGLRFITFRPRRQWEAMKPKMAILASARAQEVIHGLGGKRLYDSLVESHARFGRAFGFLAVVPDVDAEGVDTRPEFLAAKDALRDLIRKFDAWADPDIAGSEALSAFLLAPYLDLARELAAAAARASKKGGNDPSEPTKP